MPINEVKKLSEEYFEQMKDDMSDAGEILKLHLKNLAFLKAKKKIYGLTKDEEDAIKYLEIGISSEVVRGSYETESLAQDFMIRVLKVLIRQVVN